LQPNRNRCPVCGNRAMEVFLDIESAPVFCNVLWGSYDEAVAARCAPIRLAHCGDCDMICNIAFEPELLQYAPEYENSLHFSPHFQRYAQGVVDRLVERYELTDKDIIEIGCGQGDFLAMFQRRGNNRVLGFDPSFNPDESPAISPASDARIICQAYEQYTDSCPADFICCRHVLEHIAEPLELLRDIRGRIVGRNDCVVYFEVPNALFMLRDTAVWDIIYEHCCYYTARSLAGLFVRAGFEPIEVYEQYDGQFLAIEARPGVGVAANVSDFGAAGDLFRGFGDACRKKLGFWRHKLGELSGARKSVVLWGAGSKGVSFLNTLNVSSSLIEFAVDLNPRKHGRFIAGTGQRIVAPDFLKSYRPETIVIMNPVYRSEIQNDLRGLELTCEILTA